MAFQISSGVRHGLRLVGQDIKRAVFHTVVNALLGAWWVPRLARNLAYRALGMQVDLRANIWPGVHFTSRNVTVGRNAMINTGAFIDAAAPVHIGAHASFGQQVMVITGSHEIGPGWRRTESPDIVEPVHVGDGAWVGARVLLLPGVSIGPGAVVAAGSVVTADCPAHTLSGGVPARVIKALEP